MVRATTLVALMVLLGAGCAAAVAPVVDKATDVVVEETEAYVKASTAQSVKALQAFRRYVCNARPEAIKEVFHDVPDVWNQLCPQQILRLEAR